MGCLLDELVGRILVTQSEEEFCIRDGFLGLLAMKTPATRNLSLKLAFS